MFDLEITFEEARTTTAVLSREMANADRWTDRRIERQRDKHSSEFISVQCHELYWTDNSDDVVNAGLLSGNAVVAGK